MSIEVIRPGLLTTIQDTGRYGYRKYGVLASGAMDPFALRAANLIVGNRDNAAGLEITMAGPTLKFHDDALIVIAGADLSATINDVPVALWQPLFLHSGSVLRFGAPQSGCRAYLAVAGGIDVPLVMDSYSTYLRAAIGGHEGRRLEQGDQLNKGSTPVLAAQIQTLLAQQAGDDGFQAADWHISYDMLPLYQKSPIIHVLPGSEWGLFTTSAQEELLQSVYQVLPQSDRMGYRLSGSILQLKDPVEMISAPVSFGTIQVPPDGQPIALMADHQTTGGYPKIAQIATSDLPLMAQLTPGDEVQFQLTTFQEAEEQLLIQERDLFLLQLGLRMKFQF